LGPLLQLNRWALALGWRQFYAAGFDKGGCAMKIAVCIVVASALCLVGCNKGPSVELKNASGNQVAQAVKQSGVMQAGFTIQPGEWESKLTIEQMAIPGISPKMQREMKTQMGDNQVHTSRQCLTPEQVKQPKADFFTGKDKACRYEHFAMGGGKIDIQMACKEDGGTATTNMSGSYTPTTYSMDMSGSGSDGARNGTTMKMHVDAQRIGECTGKED
jgi:hypothetical protein